jgi:hypothetical protein
MLIMPASHLQTRRRFDPRQISGLGLWLDASDASTITIATGVSQWNDKSGNGRNFSQGTGSFQPARITAGQNGRNTIRADGIDDRLQCIIPGTLGMLNNVAGATLFAVRKWVTSPATNSALLSIMAGDVDTLTRANLSGGQIANKAIAGGRREDANSFQYVQSSASIGAGFDLQCGAFDYANSDLNQYINGTVDGSSTSFQTDGNTSATNSGHYTMFASFLKNDTNANALGNVEIGELLVFPSLLSALNRQTIEGYLAHKWGLASSLPSTHPYRFAAP